MFVTFEGPEGAGKSTAIRSVAASLEGLGHEVTVTREPGGSPLGVQVRALLLDSDAPSPLTELFLFLADRSENVAKVILPALERGEVVLCDRHADSTVVYQGYGRGKDLDLLRSLNAVAVQGLKPHLTLLLDLPPEVGLSRLTNPDRMDREPLAFHTRVREGFLSEAQLEPNRWQVVDASGSPESAAQSCLAAIVNRLSVV